MFRFASPWLLSIALPALLAVWSLSRRRRRADARLVLPLAAVRIHHAVGPWVRIERLVPWIRALVLLLLVVSLARPQAGARIESVSTYGVDILVASRGQDTQAKVCCSVPSSIDTRAIYPRLDRRQCD